MGKKCDRKIPAADSFMNELSKRVGLVGCVFACCVIGNIRHRVSRPHLKLRMTVIWEHKMLTRIGTIHDLGVQSTYRSVCSLFPHMCVAYIAWNGTLVNELWPLDSFFTKLSVKEGSYSHLTE